VICDFTLMGSLLWWVSQVFRAAAPSYVIVTICTWLSYEHKSINRRGKFSRISRYIAPFLQRSLIVQLLLLTVLTSLEVGSSIKALALNTNSNQLLLLNRCPRHTHYFQSTSGEKERKSSAVEYERRKPTKKIKYPCEELDDDDMLSVEDRQEKVFATIGTLWSMMGGSTPAVALASSKKVEKGQASLQDVYIYTDNKQ
jgi:hypothetical protein